NGEAPAIPQWVAERLPEYDISSDTEEEPVTTGTETSSIFTHDPQPCRIFKGSMFDHSFLDPDKVRDLFRNTLKEHCVVEDEAILILTEAAQNRARDLIVDCAEFAKHRAACAMYLAIISIVKLEFILDHGEKTVLKLGPTEEESASVKKPAKKRKRGIESCYKSKKLVAQRRLQAKKKLEEASKSAGMDSTGSSDVGTSKMTSKKKRVPVVKVTAQDMQAVLALSGNR
ncbi:unnamed protein product, partial [Cylicostephanus goldi]